MVQHHLNTFLRMAEVAAHLRDRVIPRVPVRQSVLSVPKRLRPALARDPDLGRSALPPSTPGLQPHEDLLGIEEVRSIFNEMGMPLELR